MDDQDESERHNERASAGSPPDADVNALAHRVADILRCRGVRYDDVKGRNQALFRAFNHFRGLGLSWEKAAWHTSEIFCLSHDRAKHIVSDILREERAHERRD